MLSLKTTPGGRTDLPGEARVRAMDRSGSAVCCSPLHTRGAFASRDQTLLVTPAIRKNLS
jgi:hypothetical protein